MLIQDTTREEHKEEQEGNQGGDMEAGLPKEVELRNKDKRTY